MGEAEFDDLVPGDLSIVCHFDGINCEIRYVRSEDRALAMLLERRARGTFIRVSGTSAEQVRELLAAMQKRDESAAENDQDLQPYRLWNLGNRGPESTTRQLPSVKWDAISENYAPATRSLLDRLFRLERPDSGGRLILWRGAPGTGKSRAIQALAREWSSWCDVHYITDSERFFDTPDYLMSVATDDQASIYADDKKHGSDRWRLVVAEDADEYLRVAGGRRSGAALGRLLNLCDGLLGQGANLLVLLTTNQDVGRLDPALTRPGRCVSSVEFSPFSSSEAREWLGLTAAQLPSNMTLAELYEYRREGEQIMAPVSEFRTGIYL